MLRTVCFCSLSYFESVVDTSYMEDDHCWYADREPWNLSIWCKWLQEGWRQ